MHIKMTHGALAAAVKSIAGSIPKDRLCPWRFVRIEAGDGHATFTACDGNVQIERRVKADVEEPGLTLVAGRQFAAFAAAMPAGVGEIRTPRAGQVVISSGAAKFTLPATGVEDWPTFVGPGNKESAVFLPAVTLREMLRKTAWAMSKDDTRKTLKSVHAELADGKLTMVATDGRCLGMCEYELGGNDKASVSLPEKLVGVLLPLLDADGDARLAFDHRAIRVTCDDWSVTSRAIDDVYPNWRQVVPGEQPSTFTANRAAFLDEVGRAALCAPESGCVTVKVAEGVVEFDAVCELSRYQASIPAGSATGEKDKFNVDNRLIKAALGCLDTDEVSISHTPGKPCAPLLVKSDVPWLAVVMPLRME